MENRLLVSYYALFGKGGGGYLLHVSVCQSAVYNAFIVCTCVCVCSVLCVCAFGRGS